MTVQPPRTTPLLPLELADIGYETGGKRLVCGTV